MTTRHSAPCDRAAVAADTIDAEALSRVTSPSLQAWYADPLPAARVRPLLETVRAHRLRKSSAPGKPFALALQEWLGRFWLGRATDADYHSVRSQAENARDRALVELIRGQLSMSRKLSGAMQQLDAGLALAADLLEARQYLVVLKRHEVLRHLALSAQPALAQDLASLLCEARVQLRLKRSMGRTQRHPSDPYDTFG